MAEIQSPSKTPDPQGDKEFIKTELGKAQSPLEKKLSQHIHKVWTRNQKDFKSVREDMVKHLRRVKGEYDPNKLAAIKQFRGSEAYLRTGENKCRAAESWIKDIYRGDTDIPWAIEPTAIPELPDQTRQDLVAQTKLQVQAIEQQLMETQGQVDPQQVAKILDKLYGELVDMEQKKLDRTAKKRCDRAALKIRDQNQEGGWNEAFKDFLYYLVRLPYGIIKGPVLTKKTKMEWQVLEDGSYELMPIDVLAQDVYAVSPFSFYPQKNMTDINDGDVIEIHELTEQAIADLKNVPGYSNKEIDAVLTAFVEGNLKGKWFKIDDEQKVKDVTKDKKLYHNSEPTTQTSTPERDDVILAQEFWGSVSGGLLKEWGMEGNLETNTYYQVNCWKIGKHVIKAVLNPDGLGRKPYHITSWAKNPEWIVGEGLIQFSAPIEDAINAITRALINNIAIASGPMQEVDKDRVDTSIPIYPWRTIESTSMQMKGEGPAVTYYQPNMHAGELIQAWQFFGKLLDEFTVPAYAQGASQAGVTTGTATVFTQLLAAASRSIKAVVANIDDDIITPYIQMCYDNNMKYGDDDSMQGDATAVARGINGLLAKEQAGQRKTEFLQLAMTPVLSQVLGAKNIGALSAQIAKAMDIDLPDMDRLEGHDETANDLFQQIVMASGGLDPNQENGQMSNGGGAPAKGQGQNPDGSKAGVVNAP